MKVQNENKLVSIAPAAVLPEESVKCEFYATPSMFLNTAGRTEN
jgi:hypothetical protein